MTENKIYGIWTTFDDSQGEFGPDGFYIEVRIPVEILGYFYEEGDPVPGVNIRRLDTDYVTSTDSQDVRQLTDEQVKHERLELLAYFN